MSDQYDEIELIRRIQKGDESALWQKARKFDPSKSITLKGYLGALARNTAINEKKKYISDFQINDEVIGNIPDDFNRAELRLLLTDALRKLNKDEQLILVLFYFQNEKINDISRMTGIPASTVKSRLKRCREKMKRFLEEESYMSYTIIKADEELPPAEAPSDAVWERAPLIKSHKNVDTPNTITVKCILSILKYIIHFIFFILKLYNQPYKNRHSVFQNTGCISRSRGNSPPSQPTA